MSQKIKNGKWEKFSFYTLMFLGAELLICLIINLIFGDPNFNNKISDTFLTAFLQNYNYILGAVCLLPVNVFLFSKIKDELNKKYVSESKMLLYGFLGFIIALIMIISVCSLVYPINSSTLYGLNSKTTVSIFLIPTVILILEAITYGVLEIPNLIKNKNFWKTVRKNLPIILLVLFIVWTFISCMLAPSGADDVLGSKAPKESEVLAKTLNGCYNLKDGFWAFLMYGSVLLAASLIGNNKEKEKKILIKIFVISFLVLSLITLSITAYTGSIYTKYEQEYETYASEYQSEDRLLTENDFTNKAKTEANSIYKKWNVYPQRSIFRNSNHFAYILCMAVTAAAVLALIEKNVLERLLYFVAYGVLTYMLIINDTFGGYLGVMFSLIGLFIYGVGKLIVFLIKSKTLSKEEKNIFWKNTIVTTIIFMCMIIVFTALSMNVVGDDNNIIAPRNFRVFFSDIDKLFNKSKNENVEIQNSTTDDESKSENVSTVDLKEVGSGRGIVWVKSLDLVKQRPLFGYGLECLLFQFNGQFDVNEGRTHNLLLQLLATIGIPGTIMYFLALAIIFIRLIKNWKTWNDIEKICFFVFISYMITAFTGNSSYYTSPYFMMFLGFIVMTKWKKED